MILGVMTLVQTLFLFGFAHIRKETAQRESILVRALTDETLAAHIAAHPNGTLVYFHTPDCSHCTKMAPEFEAAAKELQKRSDTSLVSVNSAVAPLALKEHALNRFPQMLWFRHGEFVRHASITTRTAPKILEFVDWALQPAVIPFATHEDFDEAEPQLRAVLPRASVPVIVGFDNEAGVEPALQMVGERFRGDTAFLLVQGSREGSPHFRAYFQDASADQVYNGTLESEGLRTWVQSLLAQKMNKGLSK